MSLKVAAVTLVLASACGGGDTTHLNFSEINRTILQPSCASASVCHTVRGALLANNLDLQTDAYHALVNAPAVNSQAQSEQRVLVKPCDAENSFLHIKFLLPDSADPSLGYGGRMPSSGNPPLPADQLAAISNWIARGALQEEPQPPTATNCTQ